MDRTRYFANLYLFARVIDAGGFAAAAREMGTTRSLLSRRIKALENDLGTRLLVRDARRFNPTATGEQVYRQAILMCDAAAAAIAAARADADNCNAQLHVGVSAALQPLLSGVLARFATQRAHIQLSVDDRADHETLLGQHNDIIIQLGRKLSEHSHTLTHRLGRMRLVIVANPKLLTRLGRQQTPHSVDAAHHLVYTGHGLGQRWLLRDTQTPRSHARMVSGHMAALLAAARAGTGFVQLPLYACHEAIAAGELQIAFAAYEPEPLPLYALTLTDDGHKTAPSLFIEFLRAELALMQDQGILPTAQQPGPSNP